MYRALYDYKTDISKYMSFQTGDLFTILEETHKDWFLAQNGFGQIGYIPTNYIVKEDVSQNEVLESIDRAIEVIHYEASSKGETYTHQQRENLIKLIEHRKNVTSSYQNPGAAPAQEQNNKVIQKANSDAVPRRKSSRRVAPEPPTRMSAVVDIDTVKPGRSGSQSAPLQVDQTSNKTSNNTSNKTLNQSKSVTIPNAKTENKPGGVDMTDCGTSPMPSPLKLHNATNTDKVQVEPSEEQSHAIDLSKLIVPDDLGNELLEKIRQNTGLSYKLSGVALETVLGYVGVRIPELSDLLDKIYETVQEAGSSKVEEELSSDYERLDKLFTELTACKDDSQQRGWALHEDEETISNNLEELISILENAKQSVSRKAIAKDNYEGVLNLVEYYQMETRLKLRLLLLKVFGAMCTLDSKAITVLLCSILTTELALELQQNLDDVQRITYVSLVLTMLFATGEPVPANLHDHLDKTFIHFLFDTIESPPATDEDDQVPEMLVHLVLAFNLHFQAAGGATTAGARTGTGLGDNLVMQVIAEKRTVKVFTEKVLLYFNRDDDPVKMFEHEPQPPNSVMKLLQDMYSSEDTASVLYTNDVKVLIDIILQHLVDLSAGDKERTAHLKLMQLYLQNSDYMEHQHRFHELNECLHRIQAEEENTGDDKPIVNFILTQIPVFIPPAIDDD